MGGAVMRKFLAIVCAALAANAFSGVQVTKQYCDANSERAVSNAASMVKIIVPNLVTQQVERIYKPEVKTNYVENIINNVTRYENVYRTIGDKIVFTNGTTISEIDALNRMYRELTITITNYPPNTYLWKDNNFSSSWTTNLVLIAQKDNIQIFILSFNSYVVSQMDVLEGYHTGYSGRCRLTGFFIPAVVRYMGTDYGIFGFIPFGGYLGYSGNTTNYLSATTSPAAGGVILNYALDAPRNSIDLNSDSITLQYPDNKWTWFESYYIDAKLYSGTTGSRMDLDETLHKVPVGGGIQTNVTQILVDGITTRMEVTDLVAAQDAMVIATNEVFLQKIDVRIAPFSNAASNAANMAEAAKTDAESARTSALSYSQSAANSASSASSSASSASSSASSAASSLAEVQRIIKSHFVVTNINIFPVKEIERINTRTLSIGIPTFPASIYSFDGTKCIDGDLSVYSVQSSISVNNVGFPKFVHCTDGQSYIFMEEVYPTSESNYSRCGVYRNTRLNEGSAFSLSSGYRWYEQGVNISYHRTNKRWEFCKYGGTADFFGWKKMNSISSDVQGVQWRKGGTSSGALVTADFYMSRDFTSRTKIGTLNYTPSN